MNLLLTLTILKFFKKKNSNYHKFKGGDDVFKMRFKYVLNTFFFMFMLKFNVLKTKFGCMFSLALDSGNNLHNLNPLNSYHPLNLNYTID